MFLPPRHLHLCHLFVLSHLHPNFLVVVACQGSCYITQQSWWLFCVQQSFLLEPPAGNLRYRINLGPVSTSLVARTYYWFYKPTTQLWCSHLNNHLHFSFYKFYKFGVLSSHAQGPPCHCRGSLARPTYQSYIRLSTLPSPPFPPLQSILSHILIVLQNIIGTILQKTCGERKASLSNIALVDRASKHSFGPILANGLLLLLR